VTNPHLYFLSKSDHRKYDKKRKGRITASHFFLCRLHGMVDVPGNVDAHDIIQIELLTDAVDSLQSIIGLHNLDAPVATINGIIAAQGSLTDLEEQILSQLIRLVIRDQQEHLKGISIPSSVLLDHIQDLGTRNDGIGVARGTDELQHVNYLLLMQTQVAYFLHI